ncbi:MAG: aminodeoxychorismate synthase component I [Tahibacter sp.]
MLTQSATTLLRERPGRADLLALAARDPLRYPALLQSVAHGARHARWDILFAMPQDHLRLGTDGRVWNAVGDDCGRSFLTALDTAYAGQGKPPVAAGPDLPFHGGWFLFLSYELAGEVEPVLRLPRSPDEALPIALALRCPAALLVDQWLGQTYAVAEPGHEEALDLLLADLDKITMQHNPELPALLRIEEDDPARFRAGVSRIHEYLRAGDIFQVNLSREWRATLANAATPASLYANLRDANPAPFAGLLQGDGWSVVSSSPERLVEARGDGVQTRPIAGTRARFPGDDDAERVRELVAHPKERAEHVMLIDLERNDLGRICVPGSVIVDELMSVESYAHVHHIVSNVRGRLRVGVTPAEIIRAVFPGGTITGCPKVRCMQIIAELEAAGRGAYTGAFGYLDRNGNMDLNILIRSISQVGTQLRLRAGAGIVVDSDAERELDETRAKARGMLRALGVRA